MSETYCACGSPRKLGEPCSARYPHPSTQPCIFGNGYRLLEDERSGKAALAALQAQKRATFVPPKGHASTCALQMPPAWRLGHVGSTPMASKSCTCEASSLSKLLRSINARASA